MKKAIVILLCILLVACAPKLAPEETKKDHVQDLPEAEEQPDTTETEETFEEEGTAEEEPEETIDEPPAPECGNNILEEGEECDQECEEGFECQNCTCVELETKALELLSPRDGDILRESTEVVVEAENGVEKVEFLIDGEVERTDTTLPYVWRLEPGKYDAGTRKLSVKAIIDGEVVQTEQIMIIILHRCGDGYCSDSEDCSECPQDCKCGTNETCDPSDSGADSKGCY